MSNDIYNAQNDGELQVILNHSRLFTPILWPEAMGSDALYGLAGEIVRKIEQHTEADPAGVLLQILMAYGNCIGRVAHFEADGTRHHANLYGVLVGDNAKGRKGTSWGQVKRVYRLATPSWVDERHAEGLSSGEGLIWAVRDAICKREPVHEKKRIVGYQDVQVDPGVDDKRLLVCEGEFAQILKVMMREGNTLSPVLRRAWDSHEKLTTLTKNSPASATGAHVSVIGHITSDELASLLGESEVFNGFGNRFLWCCVSRSKILPEGGNIERENFSDIVNRLEQAIAYGRERTGTMYRDAPARALWAEVYPALSAGGRGRLGAMTSRAEAQVMRLAMIYALLDHSPWIRCEHLRAALAVWKYCTDSARVLFGTAAEKAQPILEWIAGQGGSVTSRELQRKFGRQIKNAGDAVAALQRFAQKGYGQLEYVGPRATPTFCLAQTALDLTV